MAETRNWTAEQQQVIRLRDRNILVSAAAGSGKTAVLVERIIQKILDPARPVDVDRLLVVTFTRAAAAEMRERIGNALEQKLEEGQSERLIEQVSLLHSAQISTIDSFCKKVVEEHFHDIDLDPAFRVADEAELLLMQADICSQLLEDYYEENSPAFREFAEMYATGRNDDVLEDMILQLYSFAESYPDPDGWLVEQREAYSSDVNQLRFDPVLAGLIRQTWQAAMAMNSRALKICQEPDGPRTYAEALSADREWLDKLADCLQVADREKVDVYTQVQDLLQELKFTSLSRKRQDGVDEEKKELVKEVRDQMKKALSELKESFFYQGREELCGDYVHTIQGVQMLLELTMEFRRRFQKKKRKNNLVDFSDLEHLALQILVDPEGRPTAAAREYRDYYEEILIDEYQDSNRIQEVLLTSISREELGEPNRFMVGDVKQSIYKFRQARPELFMEKYEIYEKADSPEAEAGCRYQKIDLHKNFRSRAGVLDVTNRVFRQIMHRTLGGVEYDEDAALYLGASYPDVSEDERERIEPEILLLEDVTGEDVLEELAELGQKEQEALMLAQRIRALKEQGYRYADMVILLRTMSGWSDVFLRTLTSEGIPAVCETSTGYFSAWEVQILLNVLRVLDNPRQDIPLASVLLSPIIGMTPEQVARIRVTADRLEKTRSKRAGGLYEALIAAESAGGEESELASAFLEWLSGWRQRLIYTPVHQLIREVLRETGFLRHVSAMPGGSVRVANLEMLVQRAQSFEQTSYHGVFHFVRYIEKLHKYDVDYGEAGIGSGDGDVVRIMSIHKSKGLEFPVVMVAGMAKKFNQQDSRSTVVLHPDLGIGVDYVDLDLRQKAPTLTKKVIQKRLVWDNIGEELRVLYVAFTRAREKLILSGVVKNTEKKLQSWRHRILCDHALMKATNYLDMVMPAVLQDTGGEEERFRLRVITGLDLMREETEVELDRMAQQILLDEERGEVWDEEEASEKIRQEQDRIRQMIREELSWQYSYLAWQEMKGKITVTELKRLHLEEEEAGETQFQESVSVWTPTLPEFVKEESTMEGTTRGTLYHRMMEKLPWQQFSVESGDRAQLEREFLTFLDQMQTAGQLTQEERQALNVRKFVRFLQDPLAARMYRAECGGKLYRESPFVLGLPASAVYPGIKDAAAAEEIILVQGIIDAWLEEEDGLVLVDYKTDLVGDAGAGLLIDRYRVQLEYYERALEQLTGKRVKESMIYSFALGQSIRVNGREV